MIEGGFSQLAKYFVLGVVGLLLTLSFNLFQKSIEETGDRYYRIPLLGNEFRGKRARRAAVILIPLVGFSLMGVLQPQLVRIALGDLRVLFTLCGLLISVVLISSSTDPENWKVNDGRPLTHYAAIISLLMVIGPWVGPWLIKTIMRFLSRQYRRLVAYLSLQLNNAVSVVTELATTNALEIVVVLLFCLAIVSISQRRKSN